MRVRTPLLLTLFFISGVSALIYQVVWLKHLGLIFGNTVYAAATLIAIFLAGLGIGSELFSRMSARRNPIVVYAVIEAAVGFCGALSPDAFGLLDRAYVHTFRLFADAPGSLALARGVMSALFLLPPTILMGGTLPILVRSLPRNSVSALYGINTLGAASGVALAGFYAIPTFGLLATTFAAVVLNFALAIAAALIAYTTHSPQLLPLIPQEPSARRFQWILVAAFLMGLTSIADEVFWSRILVLHLGSSVYAFALMLFAFLVGIGIGSAAIHRFMDRIDAARVLAVLEIALAITLALQVLYFTRFADVVGTLLTTFKVRGYSGALVAFVVAVLSAIALPTAIMGATFPLVVRLFGSDGRNESRATGVVYFFNTLGSIGGSLLAGFLLIRLIGSQNGLLLMAAINLAIAVGFAAGARKLLVAAGAAAIVIATILAVAQPNGVILSAGVFTEGNAPILAFREDVTATVALRQVAPHELSLELNGVNVAGTGPELIGTQKLQGHLPLLLHANPRSVLHIGFGSGGTAYAVSRHDVKSIRIAEISPEVLEVSDRWLREVNHGVLHDPRVRAEINDGRNFVMAAPEQFDVILSDSIHPRYAGNGSLYTKDYFELCRRRLAPGGVVSMWLPMYSMTPRNFLMILRAFSDVFPSTTVWYVTNHPNAFTIVIGRLEEGPISLNTIAARTTPAVRDELASIDIHNEYELSTALLLDPTGVKAITAGIEPHVDDLPAVEYESGRLIDRDLPWLQNFALLGRALSPLGRAFTGDASTLARAQVIRGQRYAAHYRMILEAVKASRR